MSAMGDIAGKALRKAVDFGIRIEDLESELSRLKAENDEFKINIGLAVEQSTRYAKQIDKLEAVAKAARECVGELGLNGSMQELEKALDAKDKAK